MTTITIDQFENGIHCAEVRVIEDTSSLELDARLINFEGTHLDADSNDIVVSVIDNSTGEPPKYYPKLDSGELSTVLTELPLWGNIFWNTVGTYQVTYSWSNPDEVLPDPDPLVVKLLIVDTSDDFEIIDDVQGQILKITAPDFEYESLRRYRDMYQETLQEAVTDNTTIDDSNDGFPTRFKVFGNPHYTLQNPVFMDFKVTEVTVGPDVTHIGSYTFHNPDTDTPTMNITGTLALPNTLEFVGHKTIYNCDDLEHLTFFTTGKSTTNAIVDLPEKFATENDSLVTIDLSNTSLTAIKGDYAFYGNVQLETVTLPPTVIELGYWTFAIHEDDQPDGTLHSVNLEHIKHFGEDTFVHCDKMRIFDMRSMETAHDYAIWTELADPPQVVTLQNTDQLAMLVGSDDYAHQLMSRTFHFLDPYTTEDLKPFSDLYPKWTLVPSVTDPEPVVSNHTIIITIIVIIMSLVVVIGLSYVIINLFGL